MLRMLLTVAFRASSSKTHVAPCIPTVQCIASRMNCCCVCSVNHVRSVTSSHRYIRRKTDEDVERVRLACADMSQRDSLAARDARDAAQAEAMKAAQHATDVQVRLMIGTSRDLCASVLTYFTAAA
jgi:hypothetical protein